MGPDLIMWHQVLTTNVKFDPLQYNLNLTQFNLIHLLSLNPGSVRKGLTCNIRSYPIISKSSLSWIPTYFQILENPMRIHALAVLLVVLPFSPNFMLLQAKQRRSLVEASLLCLFVAASEIIVVIELVDRSSHDFIMSRQLLAVLLHNRKLNLCVTTYSHQAEWDIATIVVCCLLPSLGCRSPLMWRKRCESSKPISN